MRRSVGAAFCCPSCRRASDRSPPAWLLVVVLHAAINTIGTSLERIAPNTDSTLTDDWIQVGLFWVAAAAVLAFTGPRLGWTVGHGDEAIPSTSDNSHQTPTATITLGTTNRSQ